MCDTSRRSTADRSRLDALEARRGHLSAWGKCVGAVTVGAACAATMFWALAPYVVQAAGLLASLVTSRTSYEIDGRSATAIASMSLRSLQTICALLAGTLAVAAYCRYVAVCKGGQWWRVPKLLLTGSLGSCVAGAIFSWISLLASDETTRSLLAERGLSAPPLMVYHGLGWARIGWIAGGLWWTGELIVRRRRSGEHSNAYCDTKKDDAKLTSQ